MTDADRAPSRSRRPAVGRSLVDVLTAVPVFVITPLLRRWHMRWGATDPEVQAEMPGDTLVPAAQFNATRAISIDAPPLEVWRWLVQVGFHRAGFYSLDLIDNGGRPSADRILDEWQNPAIGDLAAPMTAKPTPATSFRIHDMRKEGYLVWAKPDSTWSWLLVPTADGTRLITRLKQRYRRSPTGLATLILMEFGDFVMMRRMLLGLKRRAEGARPPAADRSRPTGGTGFV